MSINLSEVLVVLVVALLVLKPEQLPGAAFKLGKWTKSLRGTMTKLRRELDGTVTQLSQEVSPEKSDNKNEVRSA